MTVLSARGIVKRYRKRTVVDDVSLEVASGEVVGLLGPNGAGKTTCFYVLAGLAAPDGGVIALDDRNITRLPMHARARLGVGYLAQEPSVFRKLNVQDNLLAILETRRELDRPARKALKDRLLGEFGLTHLARSAAMSLSGGERRRLEIARALATEPRFLLLDEPFAGIDPISVKDIQQLIHLLSARDIGILITDHNVRETLGICDRSYILNQGQVMAEGDPECILANDEVREVYLGREFTL